MPVAQDLEHSGLWRDLSRMGSAVDWSNGPSDILRGRGLEEYSRWLAWLVRVVRDSDQVLPLLGLESSAAIQLCSGVPAEAVPLGGWVLVRFPAKAFVAVRLGAGPPPEVLERAGATGLPVWRARLHTQQSWRELAARIAGRATWLAQNRGWAAAGVAEHFAACAIKDAPCAGPNGDSA